MSDEETKHYGISSAGIEKVEVDMPEKSPWNFFQQMVKDRPELDKRLVYIHWFINKNRREAGKPEKTIRETTYDLLEHTLNDGLLLKKKIRVLIKQRTRR